jgi:hypothetical protein
MFTPLLTGPNAARVWHFWPMRVYLLLAVPHVILLFAEGVGIYQNFDHPSRNPNKFVSHLQSTHSCEPSHSVNQPDTGSTGYSLPAGTNSTQERESMEAIGSLVTLEARAGKEADAEAFLRSAQPLALDEKGTLKWYAIKIGPRKFGIFDTLPMKWVATPT